MTHASPIRILVVDDHFVVREGIRSLIRREAGMVVIAEASHGAEGVKMHQLLTPDVTIIDLRMPVMGGVEATRLIRQETPDAKILVLTSFDGDEDIHAAFAAGASGYLLKHSSGDQVIPAVRALMQGDQWIPPEVGEHLAARQRGEVLSEREKEIVRHLALGEANKEIGIAVGISEQTVKSHVKNILAKLHVRDRTEAVTVALRRGIIHLPER
ncbi:response regulator transcription factor [Luteolibacter flavescens]|uniref:Response regulator transcription factor n=1 Tax=Luteolibacter flavescens TaxID=1859460 RepID=A0ABT3FRW7_9BACT|nr:response regulator transcription factor [Luteolibacter flavescens]MCW1886333.1 response regulator transcription factor [Luteolibacter flavescens]